MNEILSTVYSTILPSAPFVIAAYAIILIAMGVYVAIIVRNAKQNEKDLAALKEAVAKMQASSDGQID